MHRLSRYPIFNASNTQQTTIGNHLEIPFPQEGLLSARYLPIKELNLVTYASKVYFLIRDSGTEEELSAREEEGSQGAAVDSEGPVCHPHS